MTKKNSVAFTPPRLVSTAAEIEEFIKANKLPQVVDWQPDTFEVASPAASISNHGVVFNSADFLRSQTQRLLLDKDLLVNLGNDLEQSTNEEQLQSPPNQRTVDQLKVVTFHDNGNRINDVKRSLNDEQPLSPLKERAVDQLQVITSHDDENQGSHRAVEGRIESKDVVVKRLKR